MAKQYFVMGIGGTGMRCIESLIHLCAMGLFDETEIHLLALDTDKNNGNFSRLKKVKEAYLNTKGLDKKKRVANKDTFFSANIKYYEFSPNYEKSSTFKAVFNYGDTKYNHREQTDLADLVLSKDVEDFNLRHGYRAQTHLGSMMMYHSIIEAAREQNPNGMKSFLSELNTASQNGNPKVFILGSVFGGTGASSIPIIPQAISEAANIISNGSVDILQKAYFGSTLLTAYFTFNSPSSKELNEQKIIATSDKFALNSQVAMMFYEDDATVKSTYQKFYMMGTEGLSWNPMQKESSETITGGEKQTNDSHFIELLAACAALQFYNEDEEGLAQNKQQYKTDYLYRSINENNKLEFQDFVGKAREKEFAQKFGMLIAFGLFNNGEDDFIEGVRSSRMKDIMGFDSIDSTQVKSLKDYFSLFLFGVDFETDKKGKLEEGWLYQLHRSAGSGDNMLFNARLFMPKNFKEVNDLDWNKYLYRTEGLGKDYRYSYKPIISSKFDVFKKEFIKVLNNGKSQSITDPGEQLYKLVFDTLTNIYQFK